MRSAWLSVLLLAGCFRPNPPEGQACGRVTDCPDPLICDNGICVRTPIDASELPIDAEIDAPPDVAIDADLSCSCAGNTLSCAGGTMTTTCNLGCTTMAGVARCRDVDPANGVGITAANSLTTDIIVNGGIATFNTETGAITGVLTRAAGSGVIANIAFELRMTGTQPIGVWSFHRLAVNGGASIYFTGVRSAVFVSGTTVSVAGIIDASGGCHGADNICAGPGGGRGANGVASPATGCGPGGAGMSATQGNADGGGGGGGGLIAGAAGGMGGATGTGGAAGSACIVANAEPLVGGSGGGVGGLGVTTGCKGGGGGGALQITAADTITVNGTIHVGGNGGDGGLPDTVGATNAGGGCGGGAGGAILLEAHRIQLTSTSVLAANGGAGGGGGSNGTGGGEGANGGFTATPAVGGVAANMTTGGSGGAGAAGQTPPVAGISANSNAGGGGGGAGAIYLRTSAGMLTQSGLTTPTAGAGPIRTQ